MPPYVAALQNPLGAMTNSQQTILVVDDEPGAVQLMSIMLTRRDFAVLKAVDAQSALTLLESKTPDLILLDLTLPDKNGIDVCRSIRQRPETHETPILILSGLSDDGTVKKCLEVGATDFIVKPFRPHDLMTKIQTHLLPEQQDSASP